MGKSNGRKELNDRVANLILKLPYETDFTQQGFCRVMDIQRDRPSVSIAFRKAIAAGLIYKHRNGCPSKGEIKGPIYRRIKRDDGVKGMLNNADHPSNIKGIRPVSPPAIPAPRVQGITVGQVEKIKRYHEDALMTCEEMLKLLETCPNMD